MVDLVLGGLGSAFFVEASLKPFAKLSTVYPLLVPASILSRPPIKLALGTLASPLIST